MEDELASILKALQLSNHLGICDRSREIYRKSLLACPSLGQMERCRPFVSIELACSEFKHAFDRAFTVRFSASNKEQYHQAYESIRSALKLSTLQMVTFGTLALQHGCEAIISACQYVLETFLSKYLPILSPEQRQHISADDSALISAVFIATAMAFKTRIDKKLLLEKNKVNQKAYTAFFSLVREHCRQELTNIQQGKILPKLNRKPLDVDESMDQEKKDDKPIQKNPCAVVFNQNDFSSNPEYDEYRSWRTQITLRAIELLSPTE